MARREPSGVPHRVLRRRRSRWRPGRGVVAQQRAAPGVAATPARGPLGGHQLAGLMGRSRGDTHSERHLLRGDGPRPHAGDLQRERSVADRPDDHRVGNRRAAATVAPGHPLRRGALVPGVLRTRSRQRPRQPAYHRRRRRRRVRGERSEDLDIDGPYREVGPLPAAHRPDGDRARRQTRGHHGVHHRHGHTRDIHPPDP